MTNTHSEDLIKKNSSVGMSHVTDGQDGEEVDDIVKAELKAFKNRMKR